MICRDLHVFLAFISFCCSIFHGLDMSYPSDPYPFVCQAGHVRRIYVCGGVQNLKELEFNLQKGVTMEL